jgi:23S rRNA U2552 (ribose-2'-O)-methylase RlmE/FtsJ
MSIFLLPTIIDNIEENGHNICFKMSENIPDVIVSHSLYEMLCKTKLKIEKNDFTWDVYKKLTNPFEFIHTIIPGYKMQVSQLTPLSRSFYKMIEISTIFNLCNKKNEKINHELLYDYIHNLSCSCVNEVEWYFNESNYNDVVVNVKQNEADKENDVNTFNGFINKNTNENKKKINCKKYFEGHHNVFSSDDESLMSNTTNTNSIVKSDDQFENKFKSFHLAEGPGGFIEAIVHIRNNKNDEYYGMTLINNDAKCPGWKNSKIFLENNPNVVIEKGVDNTGNLLSYENFIHCYKKYEHSMTLVTGDGGIDFSEDFNNQEYSATKLIIVQVLYALAIQSNNGNFVLKVFDTFSNAMIDILYLLSSLYKNVYIMKPQTSRNANSEKYIICKGYNLNENKKRIECIIQNMSNHFPCLNSKLYIETIFNFKYSRMFISKIEEVNIIIGKRQLENIVSTLSLMTNKKFDKIDYYKKKHIQKCITWCENFNIRFNKNLKSINIFLSSCHLPK